MPSNAVWEGVPSVRGSTELTQMALLTFSLVGLQFTWGMEMTYCTPYLLELGLTKSKTSLVWIAGPLSGLIMAPVIGAVADRSKSKWGRRRPYMIGGSIIVGACLLILGWAKDIIEYLLGPQKPEALAPIVLAVFTIYVLDFAINAVQWSCRSLIIDALPVSKQQTGSAWGGRMVAVGHLVGYAMGAVDLELLFGNWLGNTQFKRICFVGAFALIFAVGVTSFSVKEAVLITDDNDKTSTGAYHVLRDIVVTTWNMPERIKATCFIQFWSWIGYFPFLFYGPSWVGEIYFTYSAPDKSSLDHTGQVGKIGSTALIVFSLVTFAASVVLPMVVQSPDQAQVAFTARPPPVLAPVASVLGFIKHNKPTLLIAWFVSHFIFFAAMVMAPLVKSVALASSLIAACGIPWASASWAPMTFMGIEISRIGSPENASGATNRRSSNARQIELERLNRDAEDEGPAREEGLSGIYLGILNLFTTLPQFVGTLISGIVFYLFDHPGPGQGASDGGRSIGICLCIGALCTLVAAQRTLVLRSLQPKS